MLKKTDPIEIYKILKKTYPNAHCELNYKTPLELAIATILSAQCTDKRVNMVTPTIFKKYKKAEDYASAKLPTFEKELNSINFYRNKAKNIRLLGQMLCDKFNGELPGNLDDLVSLPGIGRKSANVILGNAFDVPGITVDTHFSRLAKRFGWTMNTDAVKIEYDIMELFAKRYWTMLSHVVVWHGRRRCHAKRPACGVCPIGHLCLSYGEGPLDEQEAAKLVKPDSAFR